MPIGKQRNWAVQQRGKILGVGEVAVCMETKRTHLRSMQGTQTICGLSVKVGKPPDFHATC
jgi:hypothetical protein